MDVDNELMPFYRMSFRIGRSLCDGMGEDHAVKINGRIICDHLDAGGVALTKVIGKVSAYLCQVGNALDNETGVYQVFDESQTLANLYEAVFDASTGEVKEELHNQWGGEIISDDVLYVELIRVLPEHRGQNLGLRALYRVVELFGRGSGLVVIEPGPLQHGERAKEHARLLKLDQFEQDERKALGRLRRYWRQFGFRQIPGSNYFAWPMAMKLPEYEKLIPKS